VFYLDLGIGLDMCFE